jgi:hypothetical protein
MAFSRASRQFRPTLMVLSSRIAPSGLGPDPMMPASCTTTDVSGDPADSTTTTVKDAPGAANQEILTTAVNSTAATA